MVRAPYLDKNGIRKGAWSENEDNELRAYIEKYGHKNWRKLPKLAGLSRCGKSCRLRWMNYLRPDIKRGSYTNEEEDIIISSHNILGNKWATIAAKLPGRSDNEIKNYWHTHLRKRSKQCSNDSHSVTEMVQNPKCGKEKGVLQVYEKKNRDEVEMLITILSSDSSSDANNQQSSSSSLDHMASNANNQQSSSSNLDHMASNANNQQSSSSSLDHMASNANNQQSSSSSLDHMASNVRDFWSMEDDFFMDSTNNFVSSLYGHDVILIDDVLWPTMEFYGL